MKPKYERQLLLEVIEKCEWLIDYYRSTGQDHPSVPIFRNTMEEAISDLESLTPSVPSEVTPDSTKISPKPIAEFDDRRSYPAPGRAPNKEP